MAACRVDFDASPQFSILRDYWQKHGYPSIDDDLAEAFQAISKDVHANHWRLVPRFSAILQGFLLYKYRQKNTAAREGARGGWRVYALFDKHNNVLYPIIVYPKKEMSDAPDKQIIDAVRELLKILEQRRLI